MRLHMDTNLLCTGEVMMNRIIFFNYLLTFWFKSLIILKYFFFNHLFIHLTVGDFKGTLM